MPLRNHGADLLAHLDNDDLSATEICEFASRVEMGDWVRGSCAATQPQLGGLHHPFDESGWSLEGPRRLTRIVSRNLAIRGPAILFLHLIDACSELDVYPLRLEQAQKIGLQPYFEDETHRPLDHLWRTVNLSAD